MISKVVQKKWVRSVPMSRLSAPIVGAITWQILYAVPQGKRLA